MSNVYIQCGEGPRLTAIASNDSIDAAISEVGARKLFWGAIVFTAAAIGSAVTDGAPKTPSNTPLTSVYGHNERHSTISH